MPGGVSVQELAAGTRRFAVLAAAPTETLVRGNAIA